MTSSSKKMELETNKPEQNFLNDFAQKVAVLDTKQEKYESHQNNFNLLKKTYFKQNFEKLPILKQIQAHQFNINSLKHLEFEGQIKNKLDTRKQQINGLLSYVENQDIRKHIESHRNIQTIDEEIIAEYTQNMFFEYFTEQRYYVWDEMNKKQLLESLTNETLLLKLKDINPKGKTWQGPNSGLLYLKSLIKKGFPELDLITGVQLDLKYFPKSSDADVLYTIAWTLLPRFMRQLEKERSSKLKKIKEQPDEYEEDTVCEQEFSQMEQEKKTLLEEIQKNHLDIQGIKGKKKISLGLNSRYIFKNKTKKKKKKSPSQKYGHLKMLDLDEESIIQTSRNEMKLAVQAQIQNQQQQQN